MNEITDSRPKTEVYTNNINLGDILCIAVYTWDGDPNWYICASAGGVGIDSKRLINLMSGTWLNLEGVKSGQHTVLEHFCNANIEILDGEDV